MSNLTKCKVDDLLQSYLVKDACYDGVLEIPKLKPFKGNLNVNALVPFSERKRFGNPKYALAFFEQDKRFKEAITSPEKFTEEIKKFKFVVSPDCSMYRDAPLVAQLSNLYNSRKVSYYWQANGVNILPLVRWGGDLTYTTQCFHKPPSFMGIEKNSPVCVSNYGCYKSKADKFYFREGFKSMLKYLKPSAVVLYGAYDLQLEKLSKKSTCKIIRFTNWSNYIHQRGDCVG